MAERPILFNTEMVRAILDGRKTQTRRPVKYQPQNTKDGWQMARLTDSTAKSDNKKLNKLHWLRLDGLNVLESDSRYFDKPCEIGDVLWVRETFAEKPNNKYSYRANGIRDYFVEFNGWKPSIHMPRKAARIFLKVTNVRGERVNDIGVSDAIAEGVSYNALDRYMAVDNFKACWDQIYGEGNPFVWVIEFEVLEVKNA